jgi:MFS family permease
VKQGQPTHQPWYSGITRYQWLVLILASLGWVFDVFEGQIFVASMNEAMPDLLSVKPQSEQVPFYTNLTFAAFLIGGALGGFLFGVLSDRIGRKRTLTYTILTYSLFTCLSALSQEWWHMALFRFLVALGVGGEWAVASAFVAEVFPKRSRAWSQSLFHASSVLGTYLAVAAGLFIVANPQLHFSLSLGETTWEMQGWRLGFVLGVLPALLIIWIRTSLREPQTWLRARNELSAGHTKLGSAAELLQGRLLPRTLVGVGLATIGLATFWGTHIYGKDRLRQAYQARCLETLPPAASKAQQAAVLQAHQVEIKRGEMLGMFLVTTGGGLGLVCFGPLCERIGRRGAFLFYQAGGLMAALVVFQLLEGILLLCLALPIFGFLTLGMHAGFAVYFPELFPTRLRSTGGGFCFNVGRLLAAPILFLSGWMQKDTGLSLEDAAALLSLLFALGMVLSCLGPETKGKDLPE